MMLIDFKIGTNISCLGIDNSDYKKNMYLYSRNMNCVY